MYQLLAPSQKEVRVSGSATPAILMSEQIRAAEQSVATGIYITMRPNPTCDLKASTVADEVKNGTGQCCRVSKFVFSSIHPQSRGEIAVSGNNSSCALFFCRLGVTLYADAVTL